MSALESARSLLQELTENEPTSEQATAGGYRWVCFYCSSLGDHTEACLINRARNWLVFNPET
jgi:hypothetical protein